MALDCSKCQAGIFHLRGSSETERALSLVKWQDVQSTVSQVQITDYPGIICLT